MNADGNSSAILLNNNTATVKFFQTITSSFETGERQRMGNQLVMYEEELNQICEVCDVLRRDSNAKTVLVIDKNGQAIAHSGDIQDIDITSLASLAAGNVAATGGIANLLAEQEFAGQYHEGKHTKLLISLIASRVILLVLFDDTSSLGLVRLRLKKAKRQLEEIIVMLMQKSEEPQSVLAEITDDDIDNLFND